MGENKDGEWKMKGNPGGVGGRQESEPVDLQTHEILKVR